MAKPKFKIYMGPPEMLAYWEEKKAKAQAGTLTKEEADEWGKLNKAVSLLVNDPFHPGLNSHPITVLTARYKKKSKKNIERKVFESYLENDTPSAGRIFWIYGPAKAEITVIGMMPHPEARAYSRVPLSDVPAITEGTQAAEGKTVQDAKEKTIRKKAAAKGRAKKR